MIYRAIEKLERPADNGKKVKHKCPNDVASIGSEQ